MSAQHAMQTSTYPRETCQRQEDLALTEYLDVSEEVCEHGQGAGRHL